MRSDVLPSASLADPLEVTSRRVGCQSVTTVTRHSLLMLPSSLVDVVGQLTDHPGPCLLCSYRLVYSGFNWSTNKCTVLRAHPPHFQVRGTRLWRANNGVLSNWEFCVLLISACAGEFSSVFRVSSHGNHSLNTCIPTTPASYFHGLNQVSMPYPAMKGAS